MADVTVRGDELVLELTTAERLEAVHGDVRAPLSAVRSVEVVEDALGAVRGIRVGTGVPGVLVVGTIRWAGATSFVVVHHGHPRGVIIRFEGTDYDAWVVGADDPEALVAALTAAV